MFALLFSNQGNFPPTGKVVIGPTSFAEHLVDAVNLSNNADRGIETIGQVTNVCPIVGNRVVKRNVFRPNFSIGGSRYDEKATSICSGRSSCM